MGTMPPTPDDPSEIARWEETRRRRAILTGDWRLILKQRLIRSLGTMRASAIGDVDMSSNVFASVCSTLAVSYDVAPLATHPDPQAQGLMNAILSDAGYAPIMQDVQRLTLGLREMLVHVDVTVLDGEALPVRVTLRPVYPDLVEADPDPMCSYEPICVEEAREASIDGEACRWVWQEVCIEPDDVYGVVTDAESEEVIEQIRVDLDGRGRPIMPYVMYHATIGQTLWDYRAWMELVEGTLEVGVDRSAYHHALRMAAYPQRYALDVTIGSDEVGGRSEVVADPSTILMFQRSDPTVQPILGQFAAAFDPEVFQKAVAADESRLAAHAGIPVTDLLRGSGDPRSGFALLLSREGRKEASRRLEPSFRRADVKLFKTIAAIINARIGSTLLPEDGWNVFYRALPLTEDEKAARQTRIMEQFDKGLISAVEARVQLTGETTAVAAQALADIPTAT